MTCRRTRALAAVVLLEASLVSTVWASIPEDPSPLWIARSEGEASSDQARHLAVSPDGARIFLTGRSGTGGSSDDYFTVAYDATGTQQWTARYDGSANSEDDASSAAVSPDGTILFVTGSSTGSFDYDYATVAYDPATGDQLWVARYDGPAHSIDYATSLTVSPDGERLFVTGASYGVKGFSDYATVAYDTDTGVQLWVARYNEGGLDDVANALAVSPDGTKLFVTGQGTPVGSVDYVTVAYDTVTGAELWAAFYDGPAEDLDFAFSVGVSLDGDKLFVTGGSIGLGSVYDYATVAYDATSGSRLWEARYNGPGNTADLARSLAVSSDGTRLFVTGESATPGGEYDYATVAYDAGSGSRLWEARYNGPGNSSDLARSLAVSPDGIRLFVTGGSSGTNGYNDYATVAYDTETGAAFWIARYDGPGRSEDVASSAAVSPDGTMLFVTGWSVGLGEGSDYTTLAYRATTCAAGRDEDGLVSAPVHNILEPQFGPATPYLHGVSCEVLAAGGL